MKQIILAFALLAVNTTVCAQPDTAAEKQENSKSMQLAENFSSVAPALDKYAQGALADCGSARA